MTKPNVLALMFLCLLVLSVVCQQPTKAQNQSSVIINPDGSVSPSSAPIQQVGNTYTVTRNLDGQLSVRKSNITLDGNGKTLSSAVLLEHVSNVTVNSFNITEGSQIGELYYGFIAGIYLNEASNIVITNNTVSGVYDFLTIIMTYEQEVAVMVRGGNSNIFSGNTLIDNNQGMEFENTAYNKIVGNTITFSPSNQQGFHLPPGIFFSHASNNLIYHNNFEISTSRQVGDTYSVNNWDNGYPSGGNYWLGYSANEIDNSGIGDKPYLIEYGIDSQNGAFNNNTDNYPLVRPFNSTFYALQNSQPKISIISPLNQTYKEFSVCLTFSVNVLSPVKTVSWAGYSLDGHHIVTVVNNIPIINITITNMTIGSHEFTAYANDTYGNIADSRTISFTIAKPEPSSPTVPVAAVFVAVAAVIMAIAGLLVYHKKHKRTEV
jgi:parallel beta-helix repeat protein